MTRIERIVTQDGDLGETAAGQSVTVTLADAVDCSRGDVIAAADDPPQSADQFEATIVWMAEDELIPGRGYWLKLAAQIVTATVQHPKYEINVNTLEHLAAPTLGLNAIGVAQVTTDRDITFEPFAPDGSSPNRVLGGFILIDKLTNATVACGMLHFALRRSLNIHRQHLEVSRETHARIKGQRSAVLWFTGLSGAGKSTIANLVEKRLVALGRHTFLLDGDNVRHGLNRDLGFTEADRIENIRRVGEVARLMADAGLIVLTAFIRRSAPSATWCGGCWRKASSSRFSSIRLWARPRSATPRAFTPRPAPESLTISPASTAPTSARKARKSASTRWP